ncbi:MAG: hypothetical protein AAGG55_14725 [Pseudomonadota bacterium]
MRGQTIDARALSRFGGALAGARQTGVALAVVVWFVAGMSLLVAGIVSASRSDVRLGQLHAAKAQVTATGDGAINLLLADMLEGRFVSPAGSTLPMGGYRLGELEASVVAVPAGWLVDLNAAPIPVIARALRMSGAMGPEQSRVMAEAVVQWRRSRSSDGAAQRFKATEDLLGVNGVDRATLDSVRDFVAAPGTARGLAQVGPRSQLALQAALSLSPKRRVSSGAALAPLPPGLGFSGRSGSFRVDAIVDAGGRRWLRRRWVNTADASDGMPWRIVRTEPARVIGG